MNQLAVIDNDLAAKRSAAARKAVATRRARLASGLANPIAAAFAVGPSPKEMALHAWDEAVKAAEGGGMPDWHKAAYALKAALTGDREWQASKTRVIRQERPTAIPAPPWPDYRVDHLRGFSVRNPTIVVTFADGEVVRAPAVSARDKPTNIGRGLRVAISFHQLRSIRKAGLRFERGSWPPTPAIVNCVCEETGESYNVELCNAKTVDYRQGQNWRHERRRLESHPPQDQ
jgi:hypothetical protein